MNSSWRKDVFTVPEAAALLHVSRPTLYRMIRDGILVPAKKPIARRGMVIPRCEIEHYINSLRASARRLVDAS